MMFIFFKNIALLYATIVLSLVFVVGTMVARTTEIHQEIRDSQQQFASYLQIKARSDREEAEALVHMARRTYTFARTLVEDDAVRRAVDHDGLAMAVSRSADKARAVGPHRP